MATSLVSFTALANASGLAGYTGKPHATAPNGESCNQCHNGGTAPQVALEGPASLAAGQSAEYSLVVKTGQSRAAAAIAATNGITLAPVSNTLRDSFGEMVPDGSSAVAGGQATFRFRVTAPASGTTLRLWAVGLAANGAGSTGDRAAHTVRDIAVTGGSTPPPVDAGGGSSSGDGGGTGTPPPDGTDAGAADDGGSSGSSGGSNSPGADGGSKGEDPQDPASSGSGASGDIDMRGPESGCSSSPARSGTPGVMLAGLAAAAVLAGVRRRRRGM